MHGSETLATKKCLGLVCKIVALVLSYRLDHAFSPIYSLHLHNARFLVIDKVESVLREAAVRGGGLMKLYKLKKKVPMTTPSLAPSP